MQAVPLHPRSPVSFGCLLAVVVFAYCPALVSAISCGNGDTRCIERSCSAFCGKYTCDHELCVGCDSREGCPDKPPPPPSPPPRPGLPPWDKQPFMVGQEVRFYATADGKLYANGLEFRIKGVNWFGSENRAGPPQGLDKHDLDWYMKFLVDHGFNAIRILFNHEDVLKNSPLEPPNEAKYGKGAPWEAPELAHMKCANIEMPQGSLREV